MTQREQATLDVILRHVGAYNGRVVEGARLEPVVLLKDKGVTHAGDLLITAVNFRPTGARCA